MSKKLNLSEKLSIAKELRVSKRTFAENPEHQKLFNKIYWNYIAQCVLMGKDNFQLEFKGKYISNLGERINDWISYFNDYIDYGHPSKQPMHLKITNAPEEAIMDIFLKSNGFKVVDEHLGSVDTVYDIERIT